MDDQPVDTNNWTADNILLGRSIAEYGVKLTIQRRHVDDICVIPNWPD